MTLKLAYSLFIMNIIVYWNNACRPRISIL